MHFTLTLSPSQSCVKQVSKAGMLRGKKRSPRRWAAPSYRTHAQRMQKHMHSDQTHTYITITLFLHTKQRLGLQQKGLAFTGLLPQLCLDGSLLTNIVYERTHVCCWKTFVDVYSDHQKWWNAKCVQNLPGFKELLRHYKPFLACCHAVAKVLGLVVIALLGAYLQAWVKRVPTSL